MPLKLTLGKGEKLIVNGAVIKNDGDGASLVFENQAHILRQKDIVTGDTANTPTSRVYLCLQCAYLFPNRRDVHLSDWDSLLSEFIEAAPSARDIVAEMRQEVERGELYHGLKLCRKLIDHEAEILSYVE